jgi:transcriptional regulator with XRE-family HTH domain
VTTARSGSTKSRVVEGEDAIGQIGPMIRRLRQEQGLSLRDLSSRTGLSTGFLSLAERGQSSLALTSLHIVASALGTEMSEFLPSVGNNEVHPLPHVSRAGERPDLAIAAAQRTYKLLSGRTPGRVFEPLLVTVYPSETIEEPYAHEGEEFAFVLSGEVRFLIAGTEYRLGPGDSIHFSSTIAHAIHNDTTEPVEAVWVLTPRLF